MKRTILAEVEGWTPIIDSMANEHGLIRAAVFGRAWRFCQMEDGVCRASTNTIAEFLGLDRATVYRHLEALVGDGYLKDLTPDLRNRPHVYADTGKASLKLSVAAENRRFETVAQRNSDKAIVAQSNTGVAGNNNGVAQSNATVAESRMSKSIKRLSKKQEKKQVAPATSAGNRAKLFEALADICKLTPPDRDWSKLPAKVRGMLNRCVKQLDDIGATPELVRRFPAWWYTHDWRGQKHQAPKPEYVVSEWPTFLRAISGEDWRDMAQQVPAAQVKRTNGNGAVRPDATVTGDVVQVWNAVLGELKMQLAKTTFDHLLKPTQVVHFQDDQFTIVAPTADRCHSLETRIQPSIIRALTGILDRPVTVKFIVGE